MTGVHINKNPMTYPRAQSLALHSELNVAPLDGISISSKWSKIKNLPPAEAIIDALVEHLDSVLVMWELGDLGKHYQFIEILNAEPYGICFSLTAHYNTRHIVIPTIQLFLHMDEKFEEAIGSLVQAVCQDFNCGITSN